MSDLVTDADVAEELATNITSVVLPETAAVPYPETMTIGSATSGASLGNSLQDIFASLDSVIDARANNLRQIVQIMNEIDAALAGGI